MTADSQDPVVTAIYDALIADAAVGAVVADRIYDAQTPPGATYPLVVIGDSVGLKFDTKDSDGMELDLAIHCWSKKPTNQQVRQIMGAVVDALDQQALAVVGHDLIQLHFNNSFTVGDQDPTLRHGVCRFNILTEAST